MAEQVTSPTLAVGDHVRLKSRDKNQYASFKVIDSATAPIHESVDGLVLAIRDIQSGQFVRETAGPLTQYVVELLYDNTFNTRYASLRNAPRGVDRPASTPMWKRMRALLREAAAKGDMWSTSTPTAFAKSPIARQIDGWKVVKVVADQIEHLVVTESAEALKE